MIALLQIATGTGLLISGIISGLAALGGGVAALYSRNKTEERQNQYNLDAEKRQQGYIDDANEYNSPVEQMNRFRQAGLNPYLVDDPGNQGEVNSAITNTALDRSDIIQNTSNQVGETATKTGQAFQSALLEEKKYQLDVAKLDAQKAQFENQMNFNQSRFDYDQSRDQINDAYRAARDQINDTYNQSILELKQKGFTFEQEKEERRKLESDRDYNLKLAADGRERQMHDLRLKYQQTQNKYNDDAYNFFKKFELPNKRMEAELRAAVNRMNSSEQAAFVDLARESLRLRQLRLANDMTQEVYRTEIYNLWNSYPSLRFRSAGFRDGNYVNNPFLKGDDTFRESAKILAKALDLPIN